MGGASAPNIAHGNKNQSLSNKLEWLDFTSWGVKNLQKIKKFKKKRHVFPFQMVTIYRGVRDTLATVERRTEDEMEDKTAGMDIPGNSGRAPAPARQQQLCSKREYGTDRGAAGSWRRKYD